MAGIIRRGWWQALAGGCCLALLAACANMPSGGHTSPSSSRQQAAPIGDAYVVQRGDTLYSIGLRLDMNFKTLAQSNNIPPPYRILAGQRLSLRQPDPPPAQQPSRPMAGGGQQPAPAPPSPTVGATVTTTPLPAPSPPATIAAASLPAAANAAQPAAPGENNIPSIYDAPVPVAWRWPLPGTLSRGFQDDGNKGIDITARDGEAVAVAANGKVVYSGQGLIGYGNLVIVKHSETYLSAYGNNSRLLVQEGDEVAAGQSIAEVGLAGDRQATLHFEIRQAGKPVNPLDYLPRR